MLLFPIIRQSLTEILPQLKNQFTQKDSHIKCLQLHLSMKNLLRDGIIRKSVSPYNSPIYVVKKRSRPKPRLVIDFKKLNDKTTSDRYSIPETSVILVIHVLEKTGMRISPEKSKFFKTELISRIFCFQSRNKNMSE